MKEDRTMKIVKILSITSVSLVYLTIAAGCSKKNNASAPTVQPANQIVISGISYAGIPAHPGGTFTVTVVARSEQGLALTYTWTTTGSWSVVSGGDSPTATIQAPDTYGANGTATVIVSDTYDRYAVAATPISTMNNALPVISMLSASPNPVVRGGIMSLSVSATDEDGDTLTYAWSIPNGWVIQSGQGTTDIHIQSPYQYGNGGMATVTIDDGNGGVVQGSLPISTEQNAFPVVSGFTASPNPVAPGGTMSATVTASDPDGDALSYTWTTTAGWTITPATTTAVLTAPLIQGAGGYITVTISDSYGGVITGTIPIAASNAPLPPYNLQASAGYENSALTWSTSTPATSYNVYEVTGGGTYAAIGTTTTTAYKVTGLTNGTQYTFVVTGVNASGESIYSNQVQTTPALLTYLAGAPVVDLAVDQSGNIVASTWNGISVLSPDGMISQYNGMNNITYGLAIDASGNLWGTDDNSFVVEFSAFGSQMASYNIGNRPAGVAIDSFGNVWAANSASNTITELGASVITCTVGNAPQGIAADSSGNIWVTNSGDNTVSKVSPDCSSITTYQTWATPTGIAIDKAGHIWIADSGSFTVTELDANGGFIANRIAGSNPQGIAIDADGNVWISSPGSVTELNPSGALLTTYAIISGPTPPPGNTPQGIAIDQDGNVWVALPNTQSIVELKGVATGPQYFPYSGPQFAGGGNW